MTGVCQGSLYGGLPFLVIGNGPPVVVFSGLSADNSHPTGLARRVQVRPFTPLARHFTVYLVNRKVGLRPGSSIADLAGDYADAIAHEFTGAVHIVGISTGGCIAQQFAVGHPDLVRRLVLLASACRLSRYGREVQRTVADLAAAGQPRRAWAAAGPALAATEVGGRLMAVMMWLAGGARRSEPSDLIVTINAEEAFDASGDLHCITAPTLVIAGDRDRFYGPGLFHETADGIPGARLRLYPGRGHAGTVMHRPAVREIVKFLTAEVDRYG